MLISTKHNCASVFVLHLNMSTLWMMRLCFALLFLKGTEAAQVNLSSTATAVDRSDNRSEGTLQDQWIHSESFDPKLEIVESNEEFTKWRNDILKNISVLPKYGNLGRLIVLGKKAEPILTGRNEEDVFIAAAELGKGRIIAIYQDCSNNNFSQYDERSETTTAILNRNIKKWLTKGTFKKDSRIVDAKDKVSRDKLMSSNIVISYGNQFRIPLADLTAFVRNGGALLYCFTPLRMLLLLIDNKDKSYPEAPYMTLLHEAGIVYTNDNIIAPETGILVNDNKAKDAHMLKSTVEDAKNVSLMNEKKKKLMVLKILIKCGFLQLNPNVKNLFENCTKELRNTTFPSPQQPAASKNEKALLILWLSYFNSLEPISIKAPGINLFPGDFTNEPPLKSHTLELHSDKSDYHSTGLYLPAGQILKLEVISGNDDKKWELLIGCHTDVLLLRNDKPWRRWPDISKQITLTRIRHDISSPFGGLVYLISPRKPNGYIKVKLENVVDSPQFKLTQGVEGKETWENSRRSPGLWADIVGEFITITMPALSVRDLEFDALASVMKTWDSAVRLCHDLRGTNVSESQREWIVTDEQASFGYMHSGHPIVTLLDVASPGGQYFLLNGSALLKHGHWGPYHELGHNTQRSEWTFKDGIEVAANIFTLYIIDNLNHIRPYNHSHILDLKKALEKSGDFKSVSLLMYAQLAHEFGWESYKKVFRLYEAMNRTMKPTENQDKINTWFVKFSEVVQYNLAPLANFWNISLSSKSVDYLQTAFPVGFLPNDEFTRLAPERVNATLRQFPKTVRTIHSQA